MNTRHPSRAVGRDLRSDADQSSAWQRLDSNAVAVVQPALTGAAELVTGTTVAVALALLLIVTLALTGAALIRAVTLTEQD
jgi:hypothetical protein